MKELSPSMFVALYGSFRPHPWIDVDKLEEDAYSLFFGRAQMMGWSQSATQPRGRSLWGMNDAALDVPGGANGASRIAWFQVGVEEQELSGSALPLHPLLVCAADSIGRVGALGLEAVQFLVPLQVAGAPAALSSVPNWFNLCDPASRVGMRVTLDAGEDPVLPQVAAELSGLVTRMVRDPFDVVPLSEQSAHVHLEPEITDGFWMGEGRHPVTFDTVAPDWTLDSIAWTANLFIESCRRTGIGTSVLLSICRR